MRQEVTDFYAANKTPIPKMVMVGVTRKGLTAAAVEMAAGEIYDEMNAGRDIKPIRIAWEVYSRAKIIKGVADKKEGDVIAELQRQLDWYKKPWWERIFRRMADA